MRLIAGSGMLAVYTAILYPRGLLDESPTVLGLRTFALLDTEDFDVVVPIRSLVERIVRCTRRGRRRRRVATRDDRPQPPEVNTVTWAAISPPRGGWRALGETDAATLESAARAGIDEVADGDPRRARASRSCSACAPRCGGARSPSSSTCRRARRSRRYSLGFLGDDAGAPLRDGPVDAPDDAARPRAREAPRPGPSRASRPTAVALLGGAPSAAAIARPAARPVKRQPPRKVPSSAR